MASVTYIIKTDDGVTVNGSCTVVVSDQALEDFLVALSAQMPSASNNELLLAWVQTHMDTAVGMVQSYKQSIMTPPIPITFEIIPAVPVT